MRNDIDFSAVKSFISPMPRIKGAGDKKATVPPREKSCRFFVNETELYKSVMSKQFEEKKRRTGKQNVYFPGAFGELFPERQALQCAQSAQSHPHPVFPRFLRMIEQIITDATMATDTTTTIISIGCIRPPLRAFPPFSRQTRARRRQRPEPTPRYATAASAPSARDLRVYFLSVLFFSTIIAATITAAASQINAVHHQLPMVYTAAEMM